MKLKNIKPSRLITCLVIALAYPLIRFSTVETDRMLFLIDSMTLISLGLILVGIFFSMIQKGDFDITSYIARRAVKPKDQKPFSAYKADKEEEREGSFNYPLFTGILLLLVSILLTLLY